MKQFIHLRGAMGSGKTTAARQFIQSGNFALCSLVVSGKEYPYMYDKSRNICVTGRYDLRECGGMDGVISNRTLMLNYLLRIMRQVSPDVIVFEAVMYGMTVLFAQNLISVCNSYGYTYKGIALVPPLDVEIERVFCRNGGKPFKVEDLAQKYDRNIVSCNKLKSAGVDIQIVDTGAIPLAEMGKIVEDAICR